MSVSPTAEDLGTTPPPGALTRLGVTEDNRPIAAALPLVYVAWSDGQVQPAERSLIARIAREHGWLRGDAAEVLDRWLSSPIAPADFDAGVSELGASLGAEAMHEILALCHQVAAAAGGVLGIGAVSAEETAAIAALARRLAGEPVPIERRAPGPAGEPVLGVLRAIRAEPIHASLGYLRTFGDVVRLPVPLFEVYAIAGHRGVQHVLIDNHRNYAKGEMWDGLRQVMGEGLITSEGDFWRKQRKLIQPAFHKKRIAALGSTIVDGTDRLLERWRQMEHAGAPVHMLEEMNWLTAGIAGRLLLGADVSDRTSAVGAAIVETLRWAADIARSPVALPLWVPTPGNRRFSRGIAVLREFIDATIAARREATELPNDMLTLLMEARDADTGEAMSDEQVRNEAITSYVAAQETTAAALTWTVLELARNPTVRERVEREVEEMIGARPPTMEDLARLEYTTMVIEEAMRLYPPAPVVPRQALASDEIEGYTIPAGAIVMVSVVGVHRNPAYWPDPERYDPERFRPDRVSERPSIAYLPFGAGPRKCMGVSLAMALMPLSLAMIVRAFRAEVVEGVRPRILADVTMYPSDGCPMHLRPRS